MFEDTILALWIWESLRLTSGMAFNQAEQQLLHETIEREVAEHIDALHQENVKYKHIQSHLQQSEAKFRSLGDSSPDGIFLADTDGQWIYCNSQWLRITGLTADESLREGWTRAIHEEDKDQGPGGMEPLFVRAQRIFPGISRGLTSPAKRAGFPAARPPFIIAIRN